MIIPTIVCPICQSDCQYDDYSRVNCTLVYYCHCKNSNSFTASVGWDKNIISDVTHYNGSILTFHFNANTMSMDVSKNYWRIFQWTSSNDIMNIAEGTDQLNPTQAYQMLQRYLKLLVFA